jgi:hypothetical protein
MWCSLHRAIAILILIGSGFMAAAAAQAQRSADADTETLYRQRCAGCLDAGLSRAPTRESFAQMSPENIRFALTSGKMFLQGTTLTQEQIIALSRSLTGKDAQPPLAPEAFCGDSGAGEGKRGFSGESRHLQT